MKVATSRGGQWTAMQVFRVIDRSSGGDVYMR